MNMKSTTTLIITLVVGIILIAGVMTPILTTTLNTSDESGASFTNEGEPMTKISDIFSKGLTYNIKAMASPTANAIYEYTVSDGDTVLRTAPITSSDAIKHTILMTDEVVILYQDYQTTPTLIELTLMFADDNGNPYVVANSRASDFDLTIGKSGGLDVFSLTYPVTDVQNEDISARDGFVTDSGGDWVKIQVSGDETNDPIVKYGSTSQLYSYSSYGIYMDGASNITVFPTQTVPLTSASLSGIEGVTSENGYNQFTASLYVEAGGQTQGTSPSGTTFVTNLGVDVTISCDTYFVPASSSSGSGGGIDDTLASVISIIPLIMAVGLVLATISVWKRS